MMVNSTKVNKVTRSKYQSELRKYEAFNENTCHSVAVCYSGGVTGKCMYRKYYEESTYKVNNKKAELISIASCPVPKLLPYISLCHSLSQLRLVLSTMSEKLYVKVWIIR